MDRNLIIQYTIVGIIILAAVVWIGIKAYRRRKGKGGSCCGCGLADTCRDKGSGRKKC